MFINNFINMEEENGILRENNNPEKSPELRNLEFVLKLIMEAGSSIKKIEGILENFLERYNNMSDEEKKVVDLLVNKNKYNIWDIYSRIQGLLGNLR